MVVGTASAYPSDIINLHQRKSKLSGRASPIPREQLVIDGRVASVMSSEIAKWLTSIREDE
jgi:hypothetical protein